MTFSFLGGGGGSGSGIAIWQYLTKTFNNIPPAADQFIEIWNPNDPLLPEPASAHVLVYSKHMWMNQATTNEHENYPPACGSSFGYKHYSQGEIPQKVYAWKGNSMAAYPYNYASGRSYCGFNTEPSYTTGSPMMIPNCGAQGYFFKTDSIAPDAEAHYIGDWTKVFNGGNGHYWDRAVFPFAPTNDGAGSSGSFFGRGYDGKHFPGGSAGPGTDTARGPTATKIADGLLDEFGLLKLFTKGKAAADDNHADNGDYQVVLPPDLFLFGQLPFQYDTSLLHLPVSNPPSARQLAPTPTMVFAVILEFKQ